MKTKLFVRIGYVLTAGLLGYLIGAFALRGL